MALVKCKQCGNENAKDAKTCPKCGANLRKRFGCATLLVGSIVGILFFAAIGALASNDSNSATKHSVAQADSAASSLPAMPADERAFCDVVSSYGQQYKQAESSDENQIKLSQLRMARRQALVAAIARPSVHAWVGELGSLETSGDGTASFSVKLPCGVKIETWNNGLSDISDHTMVAPTSQLYNQLAALKEGDRVKVSGVLVRGGQDGFKESSVSEQGSMEDPEFVFRFSEVGPN